MLLMLISALWLTTASMMPASSCDVTFLHHMHAKVCSAVSRQLCTTSNMRGAQFAEQAGQGLI